MAFSCGFIAWWSGSEMHTMAGNLPHDKAVSQNLQKFSNLQVVSQLDAGCIVSEASRV